MTRFVLPALLSLFLLTGCTREVEVVSLELHVDELVCMDGQRAFEGRVLELEGVRSVAVNIDSHQAEIRFLSSSQSRDAVMEHLQAFGFTIDGEPGNDAARRRLPSCCLMTEDRD